MKTMSKRAWVLYVFIAAFLAGLIVLFYTFYTNADSWAMKKANRHLYSSGTLSVAGSIKDETGAVLAETKDGKRVYNSDKTVRTATMHTVGDSEGYIATGVQTSYKDVITGYNFVDGIYNLKKYGKGNDVNLTINAQLCAAAYSALGSNKGTVGVYNYKTGQLLCVVSSPSYDIANKPVSSINNDKTGAYEGVYLNRFFSGVYTPGSTFKMITSICAIENLPDIDSQKFKCTGEYKVGGQWRVLEPGMVVTIEPGLYFIDLLLDEVKKNGHAASVDWTRVDALRPYGGIRIEDEVLCTGGDADNLTRPAFAETA